VAQGVDPESKPQGQEKQKVYSVSGYLGSFQFVEIMGKTAIYMDICVQVFLCTLLLRIYIVEFLGLR
jgi:hypothetical protein